MRVFCIICILAVYPLLALAQQSTPIVDAWEPSDSVSRPLHITPMPQSILVDVSDQLISFYQKDISVGSISRCPFSISCSSYFRKAVEKYGFVGLALFIDRYFYRENVEAFSHYKLIQTRLGIIKLDDEMYLFSK
jgi:hypothetical protein